MRTGAGSVRVNTMPFGRHRGAPLSELPGGYLEWLGGKLEEWREPFRSDLVAELRRRNGATLPGVTNRAPTNSPRRESARRRAPEQQDVVANCSICGLGLTAARPLVHANCVTDEVPFR
jgi:putative quorum-sensing-regulated virulence factor